MPTTNDDDIDLTEYADGTGSTGSGNETYLLMELEGSNTVKSGYIRLGGVDPAIKAKFQTLASGGTVTWTADEQTKGEDLAAEVVSFIDDSRIRGPADEGGSTAKADNKFRTLSQTERQTESNLLHTKGGWRDHTQGNRITTTRGDKIEVIRGNFKQRVLGRSQWSNDAGSGLHWESSGGITYGFDDVPGQIVDVRWSKDDDTWRVFEECDTGHQVERYHGVMKEWCQGGAVKSRVGSLSAYDGSDAMSSFLATEFGWGDDRDDFGSDSDFDKPSDASHQASFSWPSSDTLPNVSEEVYANLVREKTICNTFKSYTGSFTRPVREILEESHTNYLIDDTNYDTYVNLSFGALATEIWDTWFFEDFKGYAISLKVGAIFSDIRCGGVFSEIDATAAKLDFKIAGAVADLELALFWTDINATLLKIDVHGGLDANEHDIIYKEMSLSKWKFAQAFFLG